MLEQQIPFPELFCLMEYKPKFISLWESSSWSPLDAATEAWLLLFSRLCACCRWPYIWSRQHLATSHIQKVLSQLCVSPGCGRCQACSSSRSSPPPSAAPRFLKIPSPAVTHCSWTLARSVSCGQRLIINSHSWQTAPAVMILWDSSRPFEAPLSGQLFGVRPRTQLRI